MKPIVPNLVSVIITAYNSERYIIEAIESVWAQTYTSLELICVNDGSTDKTAELLREYGDKIIFLEHKTNKGIGAGRNTGLEVARGEFIAFLDADDIWQAGKIERQIQILRDNPSIDIVFGHMQCFISPDLPSSERNKSHCPEKPVVALTPSAVFMRRTCFDQVGIFNPQWKVGEFIDWLARAKDRGISYEILSEVVFMRRIHENNTGIVERPNRVDYVRIAREALKRKRSNLL